MSALQFIAEMTKALAWPIVVLVCVGLFYRAIKDRIPDLVSFSLPGGVKFDFGEVLQRTEIEARQLPPLPAEHLHEAVQDAALPEKAPYLSPALRVIQAWMGIEQQLRSLAQIIPLRSRTPAALIAELRDIHLIETQAVTVLNDLRSLRNRAAHGEATSISTEEAATYEELARQLVERLAFTEALVLNMREPSGGGSGFGI